jgi:alginate O-acetyltransferase complex protein AlgJ
MTEFAQDHLKANTTIGQRVAPRLLTWLPGLFLAAMVLAGAGASLLTPKIWTLPGIKSPLTGGWQSSFEHTYDQLHPVRTPGIDSFGIVNYNLFGEGRPGVLVGEQGWLYTTEEFQTAPSDDAQIEAKLAEIGRVHVQLAAQDTQLMVLLIPAKSRVYPEHLGRVHWPAVKQNVYGSVRQRLGAQGVTALDLLPALLAAKSQGEVFLHTDTHWTPLGAKIAAETVKSSLAKLSEQPDLPAATFTLKSAPQASYSGDLLNYLPLGKLQKIGPAPDQLSTPTAQRTDSGGGGLLGNDAPAVTLVGTSYSANARWGFENQLKEALGSDLVNAAQEGKGPMLPMREYLKSKTFQNAPPKLVIWEIPERFLVTKYEEL